MRPRGERLAVWMQGLHVADLWQERDRLRLAYTEAALAAFDLNVPLLSVALPVLPGAFKHEKVRPFFDGLLPEGEARRMLAYDFRVDEHDSFGLLRALGRDCAGALVILPEGELPPDPGDQSPVPLTLAQVMGRLQQLETEPLGVDAQVRISLAGVQYKLVLSLLPSGEWALPLHGLPSTHILKRANPRFPHMVANEAFCLAIARHLGLRVAEAAIADLPDPTLIVTRYDRERLAGGGVRRIHQEDVAQALSIGASAKYEEHGGPSLRRTARLLREAAGGYEDVLSLLDLTLVNMVIGNADAHAKNVSLLHPAPGVIRLAPAYDLMSTTFYPRADVRPAMSVNHKTSMLAIETSDIIEEACGWGLDRSLARTRISDLLGRFPAAIAAAVQDVPSVPEALVAHITARADAFVAGCPARGEG